MLPIFIFVLCLFGGLNLSGLSAMLYFIYKAIKTRNLEENEEGIGVGLLIFTISFPFVWHILLSGFSN